MTENNLKNCVTIFVLYYFALCLEVTQAVKSASEAVQFQIESAPTFTDESIPRINIGPNLTRNNFDAKS